MRCDEVIRELATPTDGRDATALREHLADCTSCAGWAQRAEQLDRLWEATRPDEPSPQVWQKVWAEIALSVPVTSASAKEGLGAFVHPSANGSAASVIPRPAPAQRAARSGFRHLATIGLLALAQAAAVLLALGLAWQSSVAPPRPRVGQMAKVERQPAPSHSTSSPIVQAVEPSKIDAEIEIDEGRLIVIRSEDSTLQLVDVTPPEMASGLDHGLDPWLLMFNRVESLDNPTIASR
jgi:hypothetical protein